MSNLHLSKPPFGSRLDYLNPFSRGLVLAHAMNAGAGSVSNDISGFGNHGTLTNMEPTTSWAGGRDGFVLGLNGINNYVKIPHDASTAFGAADSYSYAFSLKTTDSTPEVAMVSNFLTNAYSIVARLSAAGGFLSVLIYDGTFNPGIISTFAVNDGVWRNFLVTRDAQQDTLNLYIDGVLNATTNDTTTASLDDGGYIALAARPQVGPGLFAACKIGYFYVWRRALSPPSILGLHYRPYQMISPTINPAAFMNIVRRPNIMRYYRNRRTI